MDQLALTILDLEEKLKFLSWAPAVFVSAETGQRVHKIFEAIAQSREEYRKHVETGPLNRKLAHWVAKQPPPIVRGHRVKFFYAAQSKSSPPTFNFVVSRTGLIGESYERYLVNRIREEYGFIGAPIRCVYLARTGRHETETPIEKKRGASKPKGKPRGDKKKFPPKKGKR